MCRAWCKNKFAPYRDVYYNADKIAIWEWMHTQFPSTVTHWRNAPNVLDLKIKWKDKSCRRLFADIIITHSGTLVASLTWGFQWCGVEGSIGKDSHVQIAGDGGHQCFCASVLLIIGNSSCLTPLLPSVQRVVLFCTRNRPIMASTNTNKIKQNIHISSNSWK